MASPSSHSHSGWLLKKGGGRSMFGGRSWHRRWFSLQDGILTWSESPTAPPKGTIQLSEATLRVKDHVKHPNYFELHAVVATGQVSEKRVLELAAPSEIALVEWLTRLQQQADRGFAAGLSIHPGPLIERLTALSQLVAETRLASPCNVSSILESPLSPARVHGGAGAHPEPSLHLPHSSTGRMSVRSDARLSAERSRLSRSSEETEVFPYTDRDGHSPRQSVNVSRRTKFSNFLTSSPDVTREEHAREDQHSRSTTPWDAERGLGVSAHLPLRANSDSSVRTHSRGVDDLLNSRSELLPVREGLRDRDTDDASEEGSGERLDSARGKNVDESRKYSGSEGAQTSSRSPLQAATGTDTNSDSELRQAHTQLRAHEASPETHETSLEAHEASASRGATDTSHDGASASSSSHTTADGSSRNKRESQASSSGANTPTDVEEEIAAADVSVTTERSRRSRFSSGPANEHSMSMLDISTGHEEAATSPSDAEPSTTYIMARPRFDGIILQAASRSLSGQHDRNQEGAVDFLTTPPRKLNPSERVHADTHAASAHSASPPMVVVPFVLPHTNSHPLSSDSHPPHSDAKPTLGAVVEADDDGATSDDDDGEAGIGLHASGYSPDLSSKSAGTRRSTSSGFISDTPSTEDTPKIHSGTSGASSAARGGSTVAVSQSSAAGTFNKTPLRAHAVLTFARRGGVRGGLGKGAVPQTSIPHTPYHDMYHDDSDSECDSGSSSAGTRVTCDSAPQQSPRQFQVPNLALSQGPAVPSVSPVSGVATVAATSDKTPQLNCTDTTGTAADDLPDSARSGTLGARRVTFAAYNAMHSPPPSWGNSTGESSPSHAAHFKVTSTLSAPAGGASATSTSSGEVFPSGSGNGPQAPTSPGTVLAATVTGVDSARVVALDETAAHSPLQVEVAIRRRNSMSNATPNTIWSGIDGIHSRGGDGSSTEERAGSGSNRSSLSVKLQPANAAAAALSAYAAPGHRPKGSNSLTVLPDVLPNSQASYNYQSNELPPSGSAETKRLSAERGEYNRSSPVFLPLIRDQESRIVSLEAELVAYRRMAEQLMAKVDDVTTKLAESNNAKAIAASSSIPPPSTTHMPHTRELSAFTDASLSTSLSDASAPDTSAGRTGIGAGNGGKSAEEASDEVSTASNTTVVNSNPILRNSVALTSLLNSLRTSESESAGTPPPPVLPPAGSSSPQQSTGGDGAAAPPAHLPVLDDSFDQWYGYGVSEGSAAPGTIPPGKSELSPLVAGSVRVSPVGTRLISGASHSRAYIRAVARSAKLHHQPLTSLDVDTRVQHDDDDDDHPAARAVAAQPHDRGPTALADWLTAFATRNSDLPGAAQILHGSNSTDAGRASASATNVSTDGASTASFGWDRRSSRASIALTARTRSRSRSRTGVPQPQRRASALSETAGPRTGPGTAQPSSTGMRGVPAHSATMSGIKPGGRTGKVVPPTSTGRTSETARVPRSVAYAIPAAELSLRSHRRTSSSFVLAAPRPVPQYPTARALSAASPTHPATAGIPTNSLSGTRMSLVAAVDKLAASGEVSFAERRFGTRHQ